MASLTRLAGLGAIAYVLSDLAVSLGPMSQIVYVCVCVILIVLFAIIIIIIINILIKIHKSRKEKREDLHWDQRVNRLNLHFRLR